MIGRLCLGIACASITYLIYSIYTKKKLEPNDHTVVGIALGLKLIKSTTDDALVDHLKMLDEIYLSYLSDPSVNEDALVFVIRELTTIRERPEQKVPIRYDAWNQLIQSLPRI